MAESEGAEEPQAVARLSVKTFVLLFLDAVPCTASFQSYLCLEGARGSVID